MGGMLRWQSCSTSDFPLKRSKVVAACQPCRTKKMRCDGRQPCSRCIKNQKKCEYRPSTTISHNNDGNNKSKPKSCHTHTRTNTRQPPPTPTPSKFQWSRLKKLSFHQDLYTALNLSTSPLSSKSGKLPPLLLEFYHLTAQPITIWTRLHLLFLKWYRHQKSPSLYSIRIPANVAKEAVLLFLKYNSLYTLFIDASDIITLLDLDPFFPSSITNSTTNNNNNNTNSNSSNQPDHPAGSLLLDTILALTFLAAGQTIGSEILLDVARFFYDTVHQRWLTMTFPTADTTSSSAPSTTAATTKTFLKSSLQNNSITNTSTNTNNNSTSSSSLKLMTQTAILLIHFQCTAICEEQAYMTSRIAQGCLERLLSMDQVTKTENLQQHTIHDHTALQHTLYAWQVWFALYLYDGQFLVSPITKISSTSTLPPFSSSLVPHQHQLWTWTILTRYTMFMESLLRPNQTSGVTIQEMMDKSQALESLSTMNKDPAVPTSPPSPVTCSEQLVGLYHTILTIQLFSTQWLPHLDFFTSGVKSEQQQSKRTDNNDGNKGDNLIHNSGGGMIDYEDMDPSKKICIEASQRILQMVSAMIMTGQYITAHRSSSPLLLFIRYRALCFAAVILVPMRQQQLLDGGGLSTYLDDSLHQLKQIMEKDLQIWPMARQCLYYLHQRLPSYFDIQDTSPTDEGFFSHYDGVDGGNNNNNNNNNNSNSNSNSNNSNWTLDDQQGRSLQTTTAMMMAYSSTPRSQQQQQRHWHGMKKRDHIDQEQLNKLSLQHDQLFNYTATMMGKRPNGAQQRNDDIFYSQSPLPHNANYSRKRHRTYPATTTTPGPTPTTDYWLPSYSLNGNSMGGPGSYLVLSNDDQSSILLSTSSSTGSSASTSVPTPTPAPAPSAIVTTSMPDAIKASSPIPTAPSACTLSETPPPACLPMVPMLSTTYPTTLQQQVMCVSQSVMASIPATNNGENSNSTSFDLMQQASSTPSSSLSNYHQNQIMVQQQQQQTMTAIAMTPTASVTSMTDNSNLLPSYQSSSNNNTKRLSTTWQYQPPASRQLLHDTFTDSVIETLHATHDPSMLIHGVTGDTHPLPPAPTSSPVDTPTPSYLDDVHLQAVSRGLSHHVSSMTTLTRTISVESTTTAHTSTNRDLISNDRYPQEWLYFLYQQQQLQPQRQQQHQNYQHHPLRPPPSPPSITESADDPFMSFSSSMSSIPRK